MRLLGLGLVLAMGAAGAGITVDYPPQGAVFPADFAAPTFLWRDASGAERWVVEIGNIKVEARGELLQVGEIDPRAVAPTNEPPKLTPEQAADHTWKPDMATWTAIRHNAAGAPATVAFTGFKGTEKVSAGSVRIEISRDAVGAPIFYRDVPLMPSETEKGVIKPLAPKAVPLIAWRLRNVSEDRSKVMMTGIHSCANCHSFSRDGKTMGLDVDGPQNNKGLYAILPVRQQMTIEKQNVVEWSTFRGKLGGKLRVGFMSQVSPRGDYVVTTINDPGEGQTDYARRKRPEDLVQNYYVANFKDYRFLQVFFPTRGILAWYSRDTGKLQPLAGADDPKYVQTDGVWSPDGKYLVFARAEAKDAYAPGVKIAERANDPNETPMKYDLYRIPFNDGKGGKAEAIAGASGNGMSNSFPKVSPDGKWIVFVQANNGQLMRPDSQLYIVPAAGGTARRMKCNTPLMNSWHSFSPNGRWLVFSSKSRSPYTQLFLTHIDEEGNDTPAVLIENTTAANRAANIPEFVNIAPDGMQKIDAVVTEYYRVLDEALESMQQHKYQEAIPELRQAVKLDPDEAAVHSNLGIALLETGKTEEAAAECAKAVDLSPDDVEAHGNLGVALARLGKPAEAIPHLEKTLEAKPDDAVGNTNLGLSLAMVGRVDEAIPHLEKAVAESADFEDEFNLARVLAAKGRFADAIPHFEHAVKLSGERDAVSLDFLGGVYAEVGRVKDALQMAHKALALAEEQKNPGMVETLKTRIEYYEGKMK